MATSLRETDGADAAAIPSREIVVVQQNNAPRVRQPEIHLYAHSRILYWWPVWVCGFTMAVLTHLEGKTVQVAGRPEVIHQDGLLGVIFVLTLMLVIAITNVTVRGLASLVVVLVLALGGLLLAYYQKLDEVVQWVSNRRIYLNLGAYFWFSTATFTIWALTFFLFDRLSYWRISPGQVTYETVFGAASKSYDADNMTLEKMRDDLFRHWILGFGSGDLKIRPFGAQQEQLLISNVLFLGSRVRRIERMLATQVSK